MTPASQAIEQLEKLLAKAALHHPTQTDEERAVLEAVPGLIACAKALDFVLSAHGEQLHDAFAEAHAALNLLAGEK